MESVRRKAEGKVLVPKVYCFYHHHTTGVEYIVIQYVEGDTPEAQ